MPDPSRSAEEPRLCHREDGTLLLDVRGWRYLSRDEGRTFSLLGEAPPRDERGGPVDLVARQVGTPRPASISDPPTATPISTGHREGTATPAPQPSAPLNYFVATLLTLAKGTLLCSYEMRCHGGGAPREPSMTRTTRDQFTTLHHGDRAVILSQGTRGVRATAYVNVVGLDELGRPDGDGVVPTPYFSGRRWTTLAGAEKAVLPWLAS